IHATSIQKMTSYLNEYYRCPGRYARFGVTGEPSKASGYFRFGEHTLYGRYCGQEPARIPVGKLTDASLETSVHNGTTYLPFDIGQVVDEIRRERYAEDAGDGNSRLS